MDFNQVIGYCISNIKSDIPPPPNFPVLIPPLPLLGSLYQNIPLLASLPLGLFANTHATSPLPSLLLGTFFKTIFLKEFLPFHLSHWLPFIFINDSTSERLFHIDLCPVIPLTS